MFRRDHNGEPERFSVVGLWGSGNVVADRIGVLTGDPTAYTMWDGHALFGPNRPDILPKYPIFVSVMDATEFLLRYADLGPSCRVWVGNEKLGLGCSEACRHFAGVCEQTSAEECLATCEKLPRPIVECLAHAADCGGESACGQDAWAFIRN